MIHQYSACTQCPRNCKADRTAHQACFCGEPDDIRAATACLHFGEEPPITVHNGSGTIFITGCNLRCAFCQNYQISQYGMGSPLTPSTFADLCLRLQSIGAENINIVTGSHHIPAIAEGLRLAKDQGLTIPVCWNSSAYETIESLELLRGLVDIWLPDLKTLNPMISQSVFKAPDYPQVAKKAIRWMIQNTPARFIDVAAPQSSASGTSAATVGTETKEKMLSGVIIRHLVLPGRLNDTKLVLDWLKQHADRDDDHCACISLMSQYCPVTIDTDKLQEAGITVSQEKLAAREQSLTCFNNRLLNQAEFGDIQELIASYDFQYLFYQELEEDTEWLPDFTRQQPFSYALAKPVWHWKYGDIFEPNTVKDSN